MAKINQPPPKAPQWPWGTPAQVRERVVDAKALDRKRKAGKKGDPKNPALASAELMESIGAPHSADELRLPLPPMPQGHDADLAGFQERPFLNEAAARAEESALEKLERALDKVRAAPDRADRLKTLLQREGQMLKLVKRINDEVQNVYRAMREAQKEEGY